VIKPSTRATDPEVIRATLGADREQIGREKEPKREKNYN